MDVLANMQPMDTSKQTNVEQLVSDNKWDMVRPNPLQKAHSPMRELKHHCIACGSKDVETKIETAWSICRWNIIRTLDKSSYPSLADGSMERNEVYEYDRSRGLCRTDLGNDVPNV